MLFKYHIMWKYDLIEIHELLPIASLNSSTHTSSPHTPDTPTKPSDSGIYRIKRKRMFNFKHFFSFRALHSTKITIPKQQCPFITQHKIEATQKKSEI